MPWPSVTAWHNGVEVNSRLGTWDCLLGSKHCVIFVFFASVSPSEKWGVIGRMMSP